MHARHTERIPSSCHRCKESRAYRSSAARLARCPARELNSNPSVKRPLGAKSSAQACTRIVSFIATISTDPGMISTATHLGISSLLINITILIIPIIIIIVIIRSMSMLITVITTSTITLNIVYDYSCC